MFLQTFQSKLRRAFSHAAVNYDSLTSLHKAIGRELVRKVIMKDDCVRILDAGCGTGYISRKMKFYFPDADVIGLDLAEGMLAQVRKDEEVIHVIQADSACLPFQDATFDIIISNLSYHWVEDLMHAFKDVNRTLKDDGIFAATLFGSRTFEELFQSIAEASVNPKSLNIRRLNSIETIERILNAAQFQNIKVEFELIKIEFQDLWDLIKWTKSIGANVLPHEGFIGRDCLERANQYYREQYPYHDGVQATLEVVWIEGRK